MDISTFLYGFVTALISVFALLTSAYFFLKKLRNRRTEIKGYLDLIPDLTQHQRVQVQEIRRVFLPKVESIREKMRYKRAELGELLFDEPADRGKIYAVSGEILAHQAELEHEVIEHIIEEKELLSASQKRRFYQIIMEQFSTGGLGVHDLKTDKKIASSAPPKRPAS